MSSFGLLPSATTKASFAVLDKNGTFLFMKKLKLNKLFHWLYAFLMLYPIIAVFATIIISAFNQSVSFSGYDDLSYVGGWFYGVIDVNVLVFDGGSVGDRIHDVYYYLLNTVLGPEVTNNIDLVVELLTHWTCVSLVYLVFDVLMLPINIAHHWIDKGSDRL